MGILEELRAEQEAIQRKMDDLLNIQRQILSQLPAPRDPILSKKEILKRLNKRSESAFRSRTPMLVKLGMRKEGRDWVINESQLEKYLNR